MNKTADMLVSVWVTVLVLRLQIPFLCWSRLVVLLTYFLKNLLAVHFVYFCEAAYSLGSRDRPHRPKYTYIFSMEIVAYINWPEYLTE